MSHDTEIAPLKTDVADILRSFVRLDHRMGAMEAQLGDIKCTLARMEQVLTRLVESQAEMRGEMRGLSSWLQAMDQRFTAIMRPYEAPPAGKKAVG